MIYYNIAIIVMIALFNLTVLGLVWNIIKGPNRLTELEAAVSSFILIGCGVVMTFTAFSTLQ